jgi:hypothetical protein
MKFLSFSIAAALAVSSLSVNAGAPLFTDEQLEAEKPNGAPGQLLVTDNISRDTETNSDDNVITVTQNSGGTVWGNMSDVQLEDNDNSVISVTQTSGTVGFNTSLIQFSGDGNDATVVQNGRYNNVHMKTEGYIARDNNFSVTQDGWSNDSTVAALGGADDNTVVIDVEGYDNDTVTLFTNKEADGNDVWIDIVNGDENRISTTTDGKNNSIDIDIMGGSDGNHILVSQTGDFSDAVFNLSSNSDDNRYTVTQTINDYHTSTAVNSNHNHVVVVQN